MDLELISTKRCPFVQRSIITLNPAAKALPNALRQTELAATRDLRGVFPRQHVRKAGLPDATVEGVGHPADAGVLEHLGQERRLELPRYPAQVVCWKRRRRLGQERQMRGRNRKNAYGYLTELATPVKAHQRKQSVRLAGYSSPEPEEYRARRNWGLQNMGTEMQLTDLVASVLPEMQTRNQSGDGTEQGRFAGSVRPNQAHQFTVIDPHAHIVDEHGLFIANCQSGHFKQHFPCLLYPDRPQ